MHPVRLDLTMRLADSLGVLGSDRVRVLTPTPAGPDLLGLVHDADFLEAVRRAPEDPTVGHGLGTSDNPIFPGMYDAAALILLAMQAAKSTDPRVYKDKVLEVANAPGEKISAGEIGRADR